MRTLAILLLAMSIAFNARADVSGVVRDADGKPIAGAKLILYSHQTEWGFGNEVLETAESGPDGAYRFTTQLNFRIPTGTTYNDYYIVTASHPAHAIGWAVITASEQLPTYDLVLTKPAKQTFIINDQEGKPVAGATVWIYGAGNADDTQPSLRSYLSLPTNIQLVSATTDDHGRAVCEHLPITQLSFKISHKGFADGFKTIDRPTEKEMAIALKPAGVVRGTVRNEDGAAVGGAVVWFEADWMHDKNFAVTNADGQFECATLTAKGGSWAMHGGNGKYRVYIRHDDYCSALTSVTLELGQTIDDFDITAEKGSILRVIVEDPDTHKRVAGVRMQALQGDRRLDGYTDANGTIEWRTQAGDADVLFISPPGGMYIIGDVPPARCTVSGDETEVLITPPTSFKPLVDVRAKVAMPDGSPGKDIAVQVMCAERVITPGQHGFGAETATSADGTFEIRKYPSSTRMCLYVESRDRKLAGTGEFDISETGGDAGEPIKLIATQSADVDLLQVAGKDVAKLSMYISPLVGGVKMWRGHRSVKTDEQSHLKLDGVLQGVTYHVEDTRLQEPGSGRQLWDTLLHQNVTLIPAP